MLLIFELASELVTVIANGIKLLLKISRAVLKHELNDVKSEINVASRMGSGVNFSDASAMIPSVPSPPICSLDISYPLTFFTT